MKALFRNIIDAPAATFAGGITLFLGVFIASGMEMPQIVLVILMAFSAFLSIFSGPNKTPNVKPNGRFPVVLLFLTCCFFLPSCAPQTYVVNTVPYAAQLETNPESVVIAPEHVTPIAGFRLEGGINVDTEYGRLGYDSDNGLSADLVIDTTSGK